MRSAPVARALSARARSSFVRTLALGVRRALTARSTSVGSMPEPPRQVAHVADAEGAIPDAGDDRRGGPQRVDPALDGLEVVAREPPPDHELEHRLAVVMSLRTASSPRCRRRSHGSRPSGATATKVCAAKRCSSANARLAAFWPASSGSKVKTTSPMPRGVRVVDVAEHAADDLDVIDAEARAAGGDRGRDAREVAGHHIRVALDDHDLLVLGDVAAGEIEPVEHLALVVDRRLGGVEVLGALVVVEQLARAEADGLAGDVADRPDQPAAEPVVGVAAVAGAEQPGGR